MPTAMFNPPPWTPTNIKIRTDNLLFASWIGNLPEKSQALFTNWKIPTLQLLLATIISWGWIPNPSLTHTHRFWGWKPTDTPSGSRPSTRVSKPATVRLGSEESQNGKGGNPSFRWNDAKGYLQGGPSYINGVTTRLNRVITTNLNWCRISEPSTLLGRNSRHGNLHRSTWTHIHHTTKPLTDATVEKQDAIINPAI